MPEFISANIEQTMKVYGYDSFVKSHCRMCHGGCGEIIPKAIFYSRTMRS